MDNELVAIIKQEKFKENNIINLSYNIQVKEEPDTLEDNIPNGLADYQHYKTLSDEDIKEERRNICIYCHKSFTDRVSLYKHNLVHLEVPLRKQEVGGPKDWYYSIKKSQLKEHKPKKNITTSLQKCETCGKMLTYNQLWHHEYRTHGKEKLKCKICCSVFKCKSYLVSHIRLKHEGLKPNQKTEKINCPKCPAKFNNKYYFGLHFKSRHIEQKFQCDICKTVFKSKKCIVIHITHCHTNCEVSCSVCGKTLKNPKTLKGHMRKVHRVSSMKKVSDEDYLMEGNKSKLFFECEFCGKKFKYFYWRMHLNQVHGEKKFKCDICRSAFTCKSYLKKHILWMHQGQKNEMIEKINCPKCPAQFSYKYSLKQHLRNSHSEQRFQCDICKGDFKCKKSVSAHIKQCHTDDGKVYRCLTCVKVYKSLKSLKYHIKMTHKVKSMKKIILKKFRPRLKKQYVAFDVTYE